MATQDWASTPSFRLFTSNRLEILVDALAAVLRDPLPSPLDREIIVVQSKGMERWISTELARRHGICANICFPFPNAFVDDVFERLLPDSPEDQDISRDLLTWMILGLLPEMVKRPPFESLKHYLSSEGKPLKAFQLAAEIAHTFDQYLTYRPGMVLRWEQGDEKHWQAVLWRALFRDPGRRHRPAKAHALFKALNRRGLPSNRIPARISVFGVSVLPRFHMEILAAVSHVTQVFLFLMNPCRQYWGDVVSEREIRRATDRIVGRETPPEDLHLEPGNSLLASMGRVGRDFFDLINEFPCDETSLFEEPTGTTLLSLIQTDILNLQDAAAPGVEKRIVDPEDESIHIHVCHGPMRELEVLHDQLLHMFEQDPSLEPGDVLVMTPDIETYAPYIEAVFNVPGNPAHRFPYNLADRSARHESPMAEAFLSILDLFGSRFKASEVMSVLECPPIRSRFDLSEPDLEKLRTWIAETRIRWGIDADNRTHFGLPAMPENTWRAGLERLMLGYAFPGQEEHTFKGILPYDAVEGADALILGKFMAFVDRLFTLVEALAEPRTLGAWARCLNELIDSFLPEDENRIEERQLLRTTVLALADMESAAQFHEPVELSVIKSYLVRRLETQHVGFGFMAGGITFCAMLPMRSIPFKVICLVGMNADAYPRESRRLGFDLIGQYPKPGDRSRRDDDRYLFLESLLSARNRFYISYVGHDIQDNTPIPASVVVSELIDYIEQGFEIPGKKVLESVITDHRLQPFSTGYFGDAPRLFTYCEPYKKAAQALTRPPRQNGPFISKGLSRPDASWKTVSIDDLCRFFQNPARFLMQRRLGISLEPVGPALKDAEAFNVEGLDRYSLQQTLLERALSGRDLKAWRRLAQAAGQLPHGTVGTCLYEEISRSVKRFARKTAPYLAKPSPPPVAVAFEIAGFRITGRLRDVGSKGHVRYRYAVLKANDYLNLWIRHIILNLLEQDGIPRTSMLIGIKKGANTWSAYRYPPLPEARRQLEQLLEIYWAGLTRPPAFFPKTSWAYVEGIVRKGLTREKALSGARLLWLGNQRQPGECEDPYFRCCFEDTDPINDAFMDLAERIISPIITGGQEVDS